MKRSLRAVLRHLIQAVALAVALILAFAVRFEFRIPELRVTQLVVVLPVVVLTQVIAINLAGVGRQSWRYTTLGDMLDVVKAMAAVAVLMLIGRRTLGGAPDLPFGVFGLPYSIVVMDTVLAISALAGLRALRRLQSERTEARAAGLASRHIRPRPVVIIGAGRAGVLTAKELVRRPDVGLEPVAFLDDDRGKRNLRVAGLRVMGTVDDIGRVAEQFDVRQAVVAIASLQPSELRRIVESCARVGVQAKIIPGMYEIMGGNVSVSRIRNVEMTDLLGRPAVTLDDEPTRDLLTSTSVLVTGAGGSIGSEVARQVATLRPPQLVLVDQSEPALWAIDRELVAADPDLDVLALVGDVTDRGRMARIFEHVRPGVVIHAAAHKHVPMMEHNPGEAVKNNVGGTRTLVDLACDHGVERFVMVSTDKAVNPTSIMGATKRLAERYVQHAARTRGIHAVSVRFGNVLGSQGSVVPIFKEQIAAGGPVRVTHPDMVRYFMTIPEAAQLILLSTAVSEPGEVLVLDMGAPVRILDLARTLIRLSGFEPDHDIAIEFTGARPGEKLFEELSLSEENATRTRHPKIWIGAVDDPKWPTAQADLDDLVARADTLSAAEVRELVRRLVPEFVTTGDGVVPRELPPLRDVDERDLRDAPAHGADAAQPSPGAAAPGPGPEPAAVVDSLGAGHGSEAVSAAGES